MLRRAIPAPKAWIAAPRRSVALLAGLDGLILRQQNRLMVTLWAKTLLRSARNVRSNGE